MSGYLKYKNNSVDSVNKVLLHDIILKLTLKQNFCRLKCFSWIYKNTGILQYQKKRLKFCIRMYCLHEDLATFIQVSMLI